MPFQPTILALLLTDLVTLILMLPATLFAVRVLRHWDLKSGSARQVRMERQTYLVAAIIALACLTQGLSLLLFIFNADHMADLFTGAMCAVGTLNAGPLGFPTLLGRMLLFFLAAAWLVLNALDNRCPDYPLIRVKYALLLIITPVALTTATLQAGFFTSLDADVITSCCGSLFGGRATLAGELSAWPPETVMGGYAVALITLLGAGTYHRRTGRGLLTVATLALILFAVTLAAVLSFVSLHVYQHPHHHCPFCLLKTEYDYMGYALYLPLFLATSLALGLGLAAPFARDRESLKQTLARFAPPLVTLTLLLNAGVALLIIWEVARSPLKLLE